LQKIFMVMTGNFATYFAVSNFTLELCLLCIPRTVCNLLIIILNAGQPKRHLLTTGWSVFVSAKRLVAGDSVLFIWCVHTSSISK
jgi:hypothetical protein